jgi:drug/metabolite transporter (DMT)-like permease
LGYLLIAGAALCWGFTAAFAKFLFIRHIDPLTLAQVRAGFSFLALLAVALGGRRRMLRVRPRLAAGLALLGVAGIAASNYTYLMAIHSSNVATAVLIQYTAPVWVALYALLAAPAGGRRDNGASTGRTLLAALLAFGGCALAVGPARRDAGRLAVSAAAIFWGLAAAFTFSFFNIWGRKMAKQVEVWTSLLWALGAATLFWCLVRSPLWLARADYPAREWALLVLYAMLSVLLPFSLFYSGLRRLPATHAAVTSSLEPIFAVVFAFLVVGERLAVPQFAGMAAVIAAVWLLQGT